MLGKIVRWWPSIRKWFWAREYSVNFWWCTNTQKGQRMLAPFCTSETLMSHKTCPSFRRWKSAVRKSDMISSKLQWRWSSDSKDSSSLNFLFHIANSSSKLYLSAQTDRLDNKKIQLRVLWTCIEVIQPSPPPISSSSLDSLLDRNILPTCSSLAGNFGRIAQINTLLPKILINSLFLMNSAASSTGIGCSLQQRR